MADKCVVFMNKQQDAKQQGNTEQQIMSNSLLSAQLQAAIVEADKCILSSKTILNRTNAIATALYPPSAAHTPVNKSSLTLNALPNDNDSTPMNTQLKTAIEEFTTSSPTLETLKTTKVTATTTTTTNASATTEKADQASPAEFRCQNIENITATTGATTTSSPLDNENDNKEEKISERNHDALYRAVCANFKEKLAYLETPVLDDNNELLEVDSSAVAVETQHHLHQYHHCCKRNACNFDELADCTAPKPKRLSDEFYSGDDADTEETFDDDDFSNGGDEKLSQSDEDMTDAKDSVVDENVRNLLNTKEASTIVDTNRSGIIEDEISTCSLNLLSNIGVTEPQHHANHIDDSSSPHSSMSTEEMPNQKQCVSVADVVEELTNQGDEHQQHRIVIENNILFFNKSANSNTSNNNNNNENDNNNVQCMDAIERRDFIREQEATGSCLLGTDSLIIERTNGDEPRLNLDLLSNTLSHNMEQIAAMVDKQVAKRDADEKNCVDEHQKSTDSDNRGTNRASGNDGLVTTPTSSRTKRTRLTSSTEKASGSNLSKSLEKCTVAQQPSGSSGRSSYSVRDIKTDFYANNSNDSLSSDNQFSMGDEINASLNRSEQSTSAKDTSASSSEQVDLNCTLCSSCNKEEINEQDDIVDDDDYDDEQDEEQNRNSGALAESYQPYVERSADYNDRPSTSKASSSNRNCCCDHISSPRTRSWRFNSSCSNACRNKQEVDASSREPANVVPEEPSVSDNSVSYRRTNDQSTDENGNVANNFRVMMGLEPENPYADWSCEVNSDGEEICTCRDYSDDDNQGSSEDELPSRDVDLSCYSISEDVLSSNSSTSTETPTSRNHRKRKLTESRSSIFTEINNSYSEVNDRKRLALDKNGSGTSQPTTPTTNNAMILSISSPSAGNLRTPRSVIPTRENPPPELSDWLDQFKQWSHVERLVAVDRLIEHCEPTQVRYMMKVIEPQFQRDFISLLPKELALQVLSYLTPKDLLRAAQTCRSWRFLCDDNLLWKEKCKQSGIGIEMSTDRPKRGRVGNMPKISSPWKAAYMRQHIIEMNWRSRPIREPKILKGHDDHVITCLQFSGNRIVSGSDDNTLKVWSAVTGKCLRTLVGHTGGVWSSQMSANIIISGSTDRTLKVWNADNGNCIHTLTGHTSTVRCMHLHGKKVVSGSRDATLRVWDIVQGKCLHTLVGHLAAVRCVQYDGKLVVSGAYDYMVKVWNPESEECLHTLQGHTNRVYSLQFDGIHVVSGSLDTSIRVWDVTSGTCKHTLMGHQSLTSGMELRQNILVSGNADSTVKVWDTTNGQCLQTLSGPNKHQSAVTCLQFNSRFVITSSDDGTVKLWDVRTGDFIRNLVTLESGGSGGVVWRIRSNDTKLICAVGSRNGTEETKLMVLDFDVEGACLKCS